MHKTLQDRSSGRTWAQLAPLGLSGLSLVTAFASQLSSAAH